MPIPEYTYYLLMSYRNSRDMQKYRSQSQKFRDFQNWDCWYKNPKIPGYLSKDSGPRKNPIPLPPLVITTVEHLEFFEVQKNDDYKSS